MAWIKPSKKDMAVTFSYWRYHRTMNHTGLSPNELAFGREKMGPGPVMYHPRQCYHASQWFEKIKEFDSKWIQAKVESQADWLKL